MTSEIQIAPYLLVYRLCFLAPDTETPNSGSMLIFFGKLGLAILSCVVILALW